MPNPPSPNNRTEKLQLQLLLVVNYIGLQKFVWINHHQAAAIGCKLSELGPTDIFDPFRLRYDGNTRPNDHMTNENDLENSRMPNYYNSPISRATEAKFTPRR